MLLLIVIVDLLIVYGRRHYSVVGIIAVDAANPVDRARRIEIPSFAFCYRIKILIVRDASRGRSFAAAGRLGHELRN